MGLIPHQRRVPADGSITFTDVAPGHYELRTELGHPDCGWVARTLPIWVMDNSYPAWAHLEWGDYVVLGDN